MFIFKIKLNIYIFYEFLIHKTCLLLLLLLLLLRIINFNSILIMI